MQTPSDPLRGLRWLLVDFNIAALCLAVGIITMFPRDSWSVQSQGPPDAITIWFASHHANSLPWFIVASLAFSAGAYAFAYFLHPSLTEPLVEMGRNSGPGGEAEVFQA